MAAIVIALGVLVCAYASALVGMVVGHSWSGRPLDAGSRTAMKLVIGLVAAAVALVLGVLVVSAHAIHRQHDSQLKQLSDDIVMLDSTLRLYGPEAQPARRSMHDAARRAHAAIASPRTLRRAPPGASAAQAASRDAMRQVASLPAKTEGQRTLQARALRHADSIARSGLLITENLARPIPWAFLGVLILWISVLFFGFGLIVRFSLAVAAALFMGAFSVAGAIFLILDLSEPYAGLLRISDLPLRNALAQLRR